MNRSYRIEIKPRKLLVPDAAGQAILSEIKDFGINTVKRVDVLKVYRVEEIKKKNDKDRLKKELFLEPFWQKEANNNFYSANNKTILEISLKPGVTNTEIDSIVSAAKDLGYSLTSAQSDRKFILWGKPKKSDLSLIIERILMNKTIERVVTGKEILPHKFSPRPKVTKINISEMADADLIKLSQERLFYLTLLEMKSIRSYFQDLGREPTDCELETVAQTWSEHCFHKTFRSPLKIKGKLRLSFIERIKAATREINHPDCLVTFSDNAGIVSFDKNNAFCVKTETHNSPSALEPYGGAMTGSGGVFRDIAGAGLGAKNIAASDIFCFGLPDMQLSDVPSGCLHPKRIMEKCIDGVRYFGNCMGIPTVNGSLSFDAGFRAKPVVLVGAAGIMPKKYAFKKEIAAGDLIVSVGGKTGRDGIHGATFSSGEMTKDTENEASSAVQIGNPIEEKKMFDALLAARDLGIIKSIADCGGGGYSSSIGEMARDIGVRVDLSKVPLKYKGLDPWEIWLSESQERMVIATSSKNIAKLSSICVRFNTSFTILGKFTGRKNLELFYKKMKVADLSMEFIFKGIPQIILEGEYRSNIKYQKSKIKKEKEINYSSIFKKILGNLNVASKEEIVRRYDHEVQGRLALKPYLGVNLDGPQDGAVVKPFFDSEAGLAFGHGIAISVAKISPYWGAALAVDEAVRNVVALGADPAKIFLLDNFIFPYPDKEVLGDLDQAVDGICTVAKAYKAPFISGKDSLSGTYKSDSGTIQVPPTVIVSSVGIVSDIEKTITSDFKKEGNNIYILGETLIELGGSVYINEMNLNAGEIPKIDFKKAYSLYKKIYRAIAEDLVSACHDISEGGLMVTLAEMCFGGNFGAKIVLDNIPAPQDKTLEALLFGESGGRFVVEVEKSKTKKFEKALDNISFGLLGETVRGNLMRVNYQKKSIVTVDIGELKNIWQKPFRKYF